ncbi:TMV resistance protein N-like [Corylus avellana]|uniref:TMV resistance protein N-like n=1 Tax=Corylus avellana TaxID=13451 RepID=UPI00286CB9E5|nr:TMV resistance protein N-like [Corylus avellana]
MAFHTTSSSFSSSIFQGDVFLSFRGEDTHKTFTAHLYTDLRRKRINTFMDDKLRSREEISLALVKAIEESKISIIVLSKNYASSRWCLDELIKILECRKIREILVLPLFYDVNPLEVRCQTNRVGEAFTELAKRFNDDEMKVEGWKRAQKKWPIYPGCIWKTGRNEPEFIDEIIERDNIIAEGGKDEEHPHDQVAIIVGVYSDGNEIYCTHGDYHKTCYGSLRYDQDLDSLAGNSHVATSTSYVTVLIIAARDLSLVLDLS